MRLNLSLSCLVNLHASVVLLTGHGEIVSTYWLEGWDVGAQSIKRLGYRLQVRKSWVQFSEVTRNVSKVDKNRGSFLGVKRRWCEANHSLHLVLNLRINGATPSLPYTFMMWIGTCLFWMKISNSRRDVRNVLLITGSRPALVTTQLSIPFGSFFIRG